MRAVAALLLLALAIGGCATPAACAPTASSPRATAFCATSDGWTLQGVEWNANLTSATELPRTVLLVHGLNEDHHSYDALAQELASRGWRVVAFDSRGMGESRSKGDFRNFSAADFSAMDHDLDAIAARTTRPDAVMGASVGSSEALRWAARAAPTTPLILLSPGLGYQNIEIAPANRAHDGPVAYDASQGDSYSVNSIQLLQDDHKGPHETHVYDGVLHGTQLLGRDDVRAALEQWLEQHVPVRQVPVT